jgi:hypothetical protein
MLILVLVFGTVTAMALPIAAAIVGLICGLSISVEGPKHPSPA